MTKTNILMLIIVSIMLVVVFTDFPAEVDVILVIIQFGLLAYQAVDFFRGRA